MHGRLLLRVKRLHQVDLDLERPAADGADVFIHNVAPGSVARLGLDLERIEEEYMSMIHRLPSSETVGLKDDFNGPICYTPDGNPLVGPAPGLRNMWLAEGFSFGITAAGGTGYYLAQMMVEGEAEIEHLFRLKMINYPFVLLEDVHGIQANVVAIDNSNAIKKAVKYLIDSGHTRIVHFAGPPQSSHTEERIDGFRHAFSESTLAFNEDMVVSIGSHYDETIKKTMKYFAGRQPEEYPTAIVCFNDHQALAVMLALNEMRIRVPEDVSVIGNDDISYAAIYPVPLTTIRAPQHEIGRRAAEILIRNIESSTLMPIERVVLETEFIVRKSSRVLNVPIDVLP